MISSLIIAPDPVWRQVVHEAAAASELVLIHRVFDQYPYPYDLVRAMNTVTPDIVFLDLKDAGKAAECASLIRAESPRAVIIGFGSDPAQSSPPAEPGIAAVLPAPLGLAAFRQIVEESFRKTRTEVQSNLLAFLPSKAGSGASTVALHTACALASAFKKKVLFMEADLRSGVLSVFLNLTPEGTIQGALRAASEMDSFKLERCLTRKLGVEFLLSDNSAHQPLPAWNQYFELLEFVRARYDWILADLPEIVNPATAEIVRRALYVFTVCTQEVLSLKLAERRQQELLAHGVARERSRLILNRWHKTEIAARDIEEFLRAPIQAVIPNDYRAFRTALYEGRCVPLNSAAGKAFVEFAGALAANDRPGESRGLLPSQLMSLFRKNRAPATAPG